MLKALWTGESGLRSHNTGLSVVSNNIANINTNGFKYSTVTFQDLMSETQRVGASADSSLGGANAQQIGLGVKVGGIDKVYTQGSLSQTDRSLDLALQGKGFFMTSVDDGDSYNYTRDGGFHLDSSGNLVTSAGYKVQGWPAKKESGYIINENERAENITIEPGLVLDANPTSDIDIKANLNAASTVTSMTPSHGALNVDKDMTEFYNIKGEKLTRSPGDKIEISFNDPVKYSPLTLVYDPNSDTKITTLRDMIDQINTHIEDLTGVTNNQIFIDSNGRINDPNGLLGKVEGKAGDNVDTWVGLFHKPGGVFSNPGEPMKTEQYKFIHSTDFNEVFTENGEKVDLQDNQGIQVNIEGLGEKRNFVYIAKDAESCSSGNMSFQDPQDIKIVTKDQMLTQGFHWLNNSAGEKASFNVGDKVQIVLAQGEYLGNLPKNIDGDGVMTVEYGVDFTTLNDLMCAITEKSSDSSTHRIEWDDVGGNGRFKVINETKTGAPDPTQWIKNLEVFQDYSTKQTEFDISTVARNHTLGEVRNIEMNGIEVDLVSEVGKNSTSPQILTNENVVTAINNGTNLHGMSAELNGTGGITVTGDLLSINQEKGGSTLLTDNMINIPNQNFKNVLNKENKNALGEYDFIDQTLDLSVGSLNTAVGEINTSFSFNNDNSAADVVNDVNTRGAEVGRVYDILKGLADIPTSLTSNTYSENIKANNTYYFTSTQDMLNLYQKSMNETSDIHINAKGADIKGELSFNDGKLELNNTGSTTFNITVEGYPDEVTENKNFTDIMNGFNGFSVPGNASRTKDINLASHVVTTQVFDNYGQAYNLDIRFEKSDSGETDGKLKWNWYASVEEPATITSVANGDIVFNGNGAYNSQSLKTITFTPNSGKNNIPVNVNLNFGNPGEFENIVSQNGVSATKSVEQNGYKKGELEDININSMGVINGIFSNGKTEQLAKLAVAMFANEEGLESIGSNTLKHSANSGEPIITSASNRGAGLVQSNAIERSNVDLSKELVNLIVQQRGLQANSKTLSTADSILETILNIKR